MNQKDNTSTKRDNIRFKKQYATDALSKLALHTMPVCVFEGSVHKEQLVEICSGVPIRIGSRYFLLSAGHCIGGSQKDDRIIAVGVKKLGSPYVPVVVNSAFRYEPDSEIDFGFWEIAAYDAGNIKEKHVFLSLNNIKVVTTEECVALDDWMMLAGYPGGSPDFELKKIVSEILGHTTIMAGTDKGPKIPIPRLQPEINLLDIWVAPEGQSEPFDIPDLAGCSGGGIWLSGVRQKGKIHWTVDDMYLVAIYIGSKEIEMDNIVHRLGRAVSIGHHLNLIANSYDDLRDSIDKCFPDVANFKVDFA